MSTQLTAPLSACVTRILSVSGFPKELRTRDINQAFADWENVQGGFKIKWVDDTSLYVVFQDPTIAKRAYLQSLYSPHAVFTTTAGSPSSASGSSSKYNMTKIRPYSGNDATQIIQSVNARGNNGHGAAHGHTRGHSSRASISVGGGAAGVHARMGSVAGGMRGGHGNGNGNGNGNGHLNGIGGGGLGEGLQNITISASISAPHGSAFREPSPTLPNLPQQPTLNALISSSLSPDHMSSATSFADSQNTYQSRQGHVSPSSTDPGTQGPSGFSASVGAPPRIGDPGRRMVAHSLGVKHPGLSRSLSGDELSARMKELQRDAQAMVIAE